MNKSSFLGDPGTLYSGQNTLAVMPSKATVSSSRKNSFSRTTTEPADSISPQPSRSTIHSRSAEEIPSTEETLLEITPMMNSKSYTKRSSLQRKMAATDVKEIIRKRGTQKTNKLETLHLGQGKPRDPPNPLISQALEQSLEYASDKIKESAVDIETWLRLAIWWLLKVGFSELPSCEDTLVNSFILHSIVRSGMSAHRPRVFKREKIQTYLHNF